MPSRMELIRWRQQRAYELHQQGLAWAVITERLGFKSSGSTRAAAEIYKRKLAEASSSSSGASEATE